MVTTSVSDLTDIGSGFVATAHFTNYSSNRQTEINSKVPTTRTVNGQPLSADVVITSVSGNAGTVTTNANMTGPITSTGNTTAIASQTGTGNKFVMDTSPVLVTPTIGVATATSILLNDGTNTTALGGYAASTFTPSLTGITAIGSTTYTATYTRIGRLVFYNVHISASTSTASAGGGGSYIFVLPYPIAADSTGCVANSFVTSIGQAYAKASDAVIYLPGWVATSAVVTVTGFYETNAAF